MADVFDQNITDYTDRLDQLEKSLKQYNRETRKQLLARLAMLDLQSKAKDLGMSRLAVRTGSDGKKSLVKEKFLYESVGAALQKKEGDIVSVSVSFARHGIFVERGVGKNRPVGSAAANRTKQEWLYPILSKRIDVLADMLAKEYADIAIEELRIMIPGVIDTKIQI